MSLLSAATMESYSRAYPFLTRLHILQEIETGCGLTQCLPQSRVNIDPSKSINSHTNSNNENLNISVDLTEKSIMLQDLYWDKRLNLMSPSVRERSTTLAVRRCILGKQQEL